ncbi:hypothetical protein GCK72_003093 [Caenorhabditis remanei]|uniref:Uncharacterized protein n=1 Tax=Caenorhabditis remanei TaxID=31234 RepID=A0A6A5HXL8_CAERE|nr:hypothetical protein GCK72_003093 [Caenorhabditis remanei]KAF1771267.1 hypothetical protein GCK72_003093 [Caenorhabditis remanei]
MSKRPNDDINEINTEAKKMAITWQLKSLTDKVKRESRKKPGAPTMCKFCHGTHEAYACNIIPQEKKLSIAFKRKIICLGQAKHHPAACYGLKRTDHLCQEETCQKDFQIHHKSICDKAPPHEEEDIGLDQLIRDNEDDNIQATQ